MGNYFMTELEKLKARHSVITDIRGRGLMIGVELASDRPDSGRLGFITAMLCEKNGVHITYSYYEPVIRIIPPLIISKSEIDFAVSVIDDALTTVESDAADLNDLIPKNCRSGPFISDMI